MSALTEPNFDDETRKVVAGLIGAEHPRKNTLSAISILAREYEALMRRDFPNDPARLAATAFTDWLWDISGMIR